MPVTFTLRDHFAVIEASGSYNHGEVVAAFRALVDSASQRMPVLVDARASLANPSVSQVRETARFADSLASQIGPKIALVVQGLLRYGIARMLASFGNLAGNLEYRAFTEIDAAIAWLEE